MKYDKIVLLKKQKAQENLEITRVEIEEDRKSVV